jgi:uncharacterized protein
MPQIFMNLHEKIENDLKSALKAADRTKSGVLRYLISALKNFQIEKKAKDEMFLSDEDTVAVMKRQVKQRKDSIAEYEKGSRSDLAGKEKEELAILMTYMPEGMGEGEMRQTVKQKISELGITGKTDFGKLMGAVMKEIGGKAEGEEVKKIVSEEIEKIA